MLLYGLGLLDFTFFDCCKTSIVSGLFIEGFNAVF